MKLARASERPDLPWSFQVVDDPVVNAFALPGGPIFISRGILTHMQSEGELVSVLGHEIGHVTARHSARQISRAQLAQVGLGVGMILRPELQQFGGLLSQGMQLMFLKFGRGDESQADDLGFKYMVSQNYDPREMADMFRTLQRVSGGESRVPEWLSTHPDPGNRVEATESRIQTINRDVSAMIVNRDPFLTRVDGLVFGENPRQGFFQGTKFLHPDLRFSFDFPSGWKTQNQVSQVIGVSAEQDAIFGLSLAGSASPSQALQAFLSQQGVAPGQASNTTINGLQAAAGSFQAQTQDGTLAGVVAFISHGGNTYRLLGYTPAQRFSSYDPAFRQTIASFRQVTDPQVLNVKPPRVRLVKIDRAMTVAEFNQRYPSVITPAQLAVVNGVDASATFPAGAVVKRVVVE
jgi:predicted Zn-dependent protease